MEIKVKFILAQNSSKIYVVCSKYEIFKDFEKEFSMAGFHAFCDKMNIFSNLHELFFSSHN